MNLGEVHCTACNLTLLQKGRLLQAKFYPAYNIEITKCLPSTVAIECKSQTFSNFLARAACLPIL